MPKLPSPSVRPFRGIISRISQKVPFWSKPLLSTMIIPILTTLLFLSQFAPSLTRTFLHHSPNQLSTPKSLSQCLLLGGTQFRRTFMTLNSTFIFYLFELYLKFLTTSIFGNTISSCFIDSILFWFSFCNSDQCLSCLSSD